VNGRLLAVMALVLLGAVALGSLLDPGQPVAVDQGSGRATAAPATTSPTPPPSQVSTTTLPSTTTTAPTRRLRIAVQPVDVEVVLTGADGTEVRGMTPLEAELTSPVAVSGTADGYNPLDTVLDLAGDTEVALWLDPEGQLVHKVATFATGRAPKQVVFTPEGSELWVTLLGGPGVEVFDPSTGERLAAIDLPDAGAVELIFDRTGDRAYASQMETASVYEIDVATRRVLRRLATESSWTKVMALSPDETRLYASNWLGNDVSEIDLGSGEVLRRLRTVTTPRGLYVDPTGRDLYVAGYEDGEIEVIDLKTGERRLLHRSGGSMRHLVGDGRGKVYASDMGRARVLVVDMETGDVEMLAPTNRAPNTIALTPDGRVLAVSNRGRNNPESYYLPGPEWGSVILIDTETGRYLDAIVGGNQPTGLAVSPDGRYLAYSDFLDDRVTVYELPATEVLVLGDGGRWEAHLGELRK
jgi:DNA-binding beta-propeller fold protein YncE